MNMMNILKQIVRNQRHHYSKMCLIPEEEPILFDDQLFTQNFVVYAF